MVAELMIGAQAGIGLLLSALAGAPAQSTSPDRSWAGVQNILLVPQFTSGNVIIRGLDADALCQRVRAIASAGAPAPVTCATVGDPRLGASGTAVVIFQAAVSDAVPGTRLLLVHFRRADGLGLEPDPRYFGSTPRAVTFSETIDDGSFNRAVRASLGEQLPWLNSLDAR